MQWLHIRTTSLGMIVCAFYMIRVTSVAKFLHDIVNVIQHLPASERLLQRVEVASLQCTEPELDWRGGEAVWAADEHTNAKLPARVQRLLALVIARAVEQEHGLVPPVFVLLVEDVRKVHEERVDEIMSCATGPKFTVSVRAC